MHETGRSAHMDQIRDGKVLRTMNAEFFDFEQQGSQVARVSPFEFRPGDTFNAHFTYEGALGDERNFGYGSRDEMSNAYIVYYPAQRIGFYPWSCVYGVDDIFPPCSSELYLGGGMMDDSVSDVVQELQVQTEEGVNKRVFGEDTSGTCQVASSARKVTGRARVGAVFLVSVFL